MRKRTPLSARTIHEIRKLYRSGNYSQRELAELYDRDKREITAYVHGFPSLTKHLEYLAQKRGFRSIPAYKKRLVTQKGFVSCAEYQRVFVDTNALDDRLLDTEPSAFPSEDDFDMLD